MTISKGLISKALLFVAIPALILGLFDPLEGGLGLLIATAIYTVAFGLIRSKPPRTLWIPLASTVVFAALTVAVAVLVSETSQAEGLPGYLIAMIVIYELGAFVTLLAGVHTAYRSLKPKVTPTST